MTTLLHSDAVGLQKGDLVLNCDTDEIVSAHTIQLLKACDGYPSTLHLQLRNYLYSFEFPYDVQSWRAHVTKWDPAATIYYHSRFPGDDTMLADSGK